MNIQQSGIKTKKYTGTSRFKNKVTSICTKLRWCNEVDTAKKVNKIIYNLQNIR